MNEAFEYVREGSLGYWRGSRWAVEGITHGFLGRSFDVRSQREVWSEFWPEPLLCLEQVHGVEICSRPETPEPTADAWILDPKHLEPRPAAYGIITADCTPLLLQCPKSGIRAAAHCGWRGATAGLLPRTIAGMLERGASIAHLELLIGPSALSCCYEIGADLGQLIRSVLPAAEKNNPRFSRLLQERRSKLFCEIGLLLKAQAQEAGIDSDRIETLELCTICDLRFFSYRREKEEAGRQVSFISASVASKLS